MSTPAEPEGWEELLLADPGAADFVEIWNRGEAQRRHAAEIEKSMLYAIENGYDFDPVTGQYLPPKGEE